MRNEMEEISGSNLPCAEQPVRCLETPNELQLSSSTFPPNLSITPEQVRRELKKKIHAGKVANPDDVTNKV